MKIKFLDTKEDLAQHQKYKKSIPTISTIEQLCGHQNRSATLFWFHVANETFAFCSVLVLVGVSAPAASVQIPNVQVHNPKLQSITLILNICLLCPGGTFGHKLVQLRNALMCNTLVFFCSCQSSTVEQRCWAIISSVTAPRVNKAKTNIKVASQSISGGSVLRCLTLK